MTAEQKLTADTVALCVRLMEYFETTTANLLEHCDAVELENARLKKEIEKLREEHFDTFLDSIIDDK